jgi:sulfotransferase family protein
MRFRRKALPLIFLAPVLPPRRLPERPIFVIGCPRSGTTLLFNLLARAPGLTSIGGEGHALWETFHHPRAKGWESHALGARDVGAVERRYLAWATRVLGGRGRFVDKTPRNVLRLDYLEALFPDATYVFIYRDGRAITSSLIDGWRLRRAPYPTPPGFALEGMADRHWRFLLQPGWRDLNGRPVEEMAAAQYVASIDAMLAFREGLPPERAVEVRYEELLAAPARVIEGVFDRLGVPFGGAEAERVMATVEPAPAVEKWRTRHPEEIARILPRIRAALERTGYR